MAIYSTNRFKNLDADRVELAFRESAPDVTNSDEDLLSEAPDVTDGGEILSEAPDVTDGGDIISEAPDVTTGESDLVAEAAIVDSLLESLED